MNVYTAIGRLGRDAEVKYTQDGKAITRFAVAVDDGFGDRKVTSWIDCALFGDRGPKIAEHIRKGDRIGITGSIRLDTYTAGDGAERSKIAMRVQDVTLLGDKRQDSGNGTSRQSAPRATERPQRATNAPVDEFADDPIPFVRQMGPW